MSIWRVSLGSRMTWNRGGKEDGVGESENLEPRIRDIGEVMTLWGIRDISKKAGSGHSTKVIKKGRSTGYALGVLNEVKTIVQYSNPEKREELRVTELSICNFGWTAFSRRGDSRSVAFEHRGWVVLELPNIRLIPLNERSADWDIRGVIGLIHEASPYYGRYETPYTMVTYITPIDKVFKDIAKMTNAKSITVNTTNPELSPAEDWFIAFAAEQKLAQKCVIETWWYIWEFDSALIALGAFWLWLLELFYELKQASHCLLGYARQKQ